MAALTIAHLLDRSKPVGLFGLPHALQTLHFRYCFGTTPPKGLPHT